MGEKRAGAERRLRSVTRLMSVFMAGTAIAIAHAAFGQDFPSKSIRIVTPGTGGSSDFSGRLIAQELSVIFSQPVVVDNRPTGPIPGEIVAKAPPDGYTLLLAGGSFYIGPLMQDTPYDPVKDFAPISLTTTQPSVLVVHPSMPVNSARDLIVLAKSRPGALNYSMAGIGSSGHLAAELFKAMAGINVARINYKGAGAALSDLVAGQVQFAFATAGSVTSLIKSNRLKALAVTSARPSALFPGLPTVASSGLPGYETVSNLGMFAPAKTPAAIINRLNQEIVRVLGTASIREKFLSAGTEAVGSSPEQFAATIKSEMARLGKVIKDSGIRVE